MDIYKEAIPPTFRILTTHPCQHSEGHGTKHKQLSKALMRTGIMISRNIFQRRLSRSDGTGLGRIEPLSALVVEGGYNSVILGLKELTMSNCEVAFPLVYRGDATNVTLKIVIDDNEHDETYIAAVLYGTKNVPFIEGASKDTTEGAVRSLMETSAQVLGRLKREGKLATARAMEHLAGGGKVNWMPPKEPATPITESNPGDSASVRTPLTLDTSPSSESGLSSATGSFNPIPEQYRGDKEDEDVFIVARSHGPVQ